MEARFVANLTNLKMSSSESFDLQIGKLVHPIQFSLLNFLGLDFMRTFGVQGMQRVENEWCVACHALLSTLKRIAEALERDIKDFL